MAYCWYFCNPRLPLRLKDRRQTAFDLHKKMYTALATSVSRVQISSILIANHTYRGDTNTLNKVCCSGLANDLTSRINRRRKGEKVTWTLDKYIRSPATFFSGARVVSDRASMLPNVPDSGARQVVVRITSRQSKSRAKTPTEDPSVTTQDCTEYIVLQKPRWFGEEHEWRIWGHATPTTLEDLDTPAFAPGLSVQERMEGVKSMMR